MKTLINTTTNLIAITEMSQEEYAIFLDLLYDKHTQLTEIQQLSNSARLQIAIDLGYRKSIIFSQDADTAALAALDCDIEIELSKVGSLITTMSTPTAPDVEDCKVIDISIK